MGNHVNSFRDFQAPVAGADAYLLEAGDKYLLENGDKYLLE